MSANTIPNSIDLRNLPIWDFRVRVRDIEIPFISPLEVSEMSASPMPTQAQIDAKLDRWPGLFVWLWRVIAGNPRVNASDLPTDGGASHTRKTCVAMLGDSYAELVDEISTGECAQIINAYLSCQEEWMIACSRVVRATASERMRVLAPETDPAPESPSSPSMVKLVPGQKFPFDAKLNPMLHKDENAS